MEVSVLIGILTGVYTPQEAQNLPRLIFVDLPYGVSLRMKLVDYRGSGSNMSTYLEIYIALFDHFLALGVAETRSARCLSPTLNLHDPHRMHLTEETLGQRGKVTYNLPQPKIHVIIIN